MKLIILRGLPGTGKTIIAKKLTQQIQNSIVIHVDEFKIDYRKLNKDCKFIDACKHSYKKTIKKLSSITDKEIAIIEELFYDSNFVNKII